MELKQEQLDNIKFHYENALIMLNKGRADLATKQLYQLMNYDDYDLSLDVMYNRNEYFKYEELRQLILNVDEQLSNYSLKSNEEILENDEFIGDIF